MNSLENLVRTMMVVVVIATVSVGFAQPQARAELQQLRQQAQRLTVLQALPEEARTAAAGLLEQSQTLSDSATTLRTQRLEAYVAALEAGESPMIARELADQAVSDARLALLRDAEAFRAEVDAFVDTYPQARGALGRFQGAWQGWQRGWDEDTGFGSDQFGNQPGMMQRGNMGQPGMMPRGNRQHSQHMGQPDGQFGSGYGNPDMMQQGNRQSMGQPGMMPRGNHQNMAQRGNRQNMGQRGGQSGQGYGNHQNMAQRSRMQRGNAGGNYGQGCYNNLGTPQQQQQLQQQDGSGAPAGTPQQNQQNGVSQPASPPQNPQQQLQQQDGSGPPDNAPQGQQNGN